MRMPVVVRLCLILGGLAVAGAIVLLAPVARHGDGPQPEVLQSQHHTLAIGASSARSLQGANRAVGPDAANEPVTELNAQERADRIQRVSRIIALLQKSGAPRLDEQQRRDLEDFLLDPQRVEGVSDFPPAREYAVVHEVMALLRQTSDPAGDFARLLTEVFDDVRQTAVVRDYALQHLGEWYDRASSREAVEQVLWRATDERGATMAGTALLALHRQVLPRDDRMRTRLSDACHRVVVDARASTAERVTALRLGAQLGNRELLPLAREWIQQSADPMMQLAAIGALGELGDVRDIPLVQELKEHPRLKMAVTASLRRLERKGAKPL